MNPNLKPTTAPHETAFAVIDVQTDFFEGGPLGAPGGSMIIPFVNERIVSGDYGTIFATADAHAEDHESFKIWPRHCVRNTLGAQFHPGILSDWFDIIWRKGAGHNVDSYGAFYDNLGRPSRGIECLKARGVKAVDFGGLVTEVCVGISALQAAPHFKTRILLPACRGIGVRPCDVPGLVDSVRAAGLEMKYPEDMLASLKAAGVEIVGA